MQLSSVAALFLLLAAAGGLWVGGQALGEMSDLRATFWLLTGAVSLRASIALTDKRRP
jgi:hypothetical protein